MLVDSPPNKPLDIGSVGQSVHCYSRSVEGVRGRAVRYRRNPLPWGGRGNPDIGGVGLPWDYDRILAQPQCWSGHARHLPMRGGGVSQIRRQEGTHNQKKAPSPCS